MRAVNWEPFIRIGLAALLAVPIGLDRELRAKPAGLRTHVVVSLASAAFGYVSVLAAEGQGNDQTRIAAQVVSGIGFMGAGVIFASGNRVHGLTTAAALWAASAIGLCVGLGFTGLAVATALITAVVLSPLDWLSERVVDRVGTRERTFTVIVADVADLKEIQDGIDSRGGTIRDMQLAAIEGSIGARIVVRCTTAALRDIRTYLTTNPDVHFTTTSTLESAE